ncbi:hypothetical protein [Streptomyces sp. V3I7]|uniref:hypothetical protein n=1 Tax=Streptomyces sp. V3I7 TaxID=3042278 RepID=UPI00278794B8|nr:hypothetical protein [Streptomyces sp. V3I7]MDQ0994737.1 hypothetical protein [Streptomyces sp. V3I7]
MFVLLALKVSNTAGAIVTGGLGAVAAALAGFISKTFKSAPLDAKGLAAQLQELLPGQGSDRGHKAGHPTYRPIGRAGRTRRSRLPSWPDD